MEISVKIIEILEAKKIIKGDKSFEIQTIIANYTENLNTKSIAFTLWNEMVNSSKIKLGEVINFHFDIVAKSNIKGTWFNEIRVWRIND